MKLQRHQCDVLICGAGPLGLWTARLLRDQGYGVVVVDANPLGDCQAIHSEGFIHRGFLAKPKSRQQFIEAWEQWEPWFQQYSKAENAPPHFRRTELVFADSGSWSTEIADFHHSKLIPTPSEPTDPSWRTFDATSCGFLSEIPEYLETPSAAIARNDQLSVQFAVSTSEFATEPEWLLTRLIEAIQPCVYASTRILSISPGYCGIDKIFAVELEPPDGVSFILEAKAVVSAAGGSNFEILKMFDPSGQRQELDKTTIQNSKWAYVLVVESDASAGSLLPFANINYGKMRGGLFIVSRRGMLCRENVKWLISNEIGWTSADAPDFDQRPKTARDWLQRLMPDLLLIEALAQDKPYKYGMYKARKIDPRLERETSDSDLSKYGLQRVDSELELLSLESEPFWLGYPFRLSLVPRIAKKIVTEIDAYNFKKGPVTPLPTSNKASVGDFRPKCATVTMYDWSRLFGPTPPLEDWCDWPPWNEQS